MVKIAGEAEIEQPLISPVSKTECVWWQWLIEKEMDKPKTKKDANSRIKLRSNISEEYFFVDDQTGKAVVDPQGAEITTENTMVLRIYKHSDTNDKARKFLNTVGISPDDMYDWQEFILTEKVIPYKNNIKVLGNASFTYPIDKYGLTEKLPLFKKNSKKAMLMLTNKKSFELADEQSSEAVRSIVVAIAVMVVSVVLIAISIISMF